MQLCFRYKNVISTRITNLVTDNITEELESSNKFIVNHLYNNDVKVPITDDIIVGDRLRDIYNIPQQITFKSPMFNKDPYNVVEVPKADLSRSADYL